jgi:hypothetical protein
VKASTNVVTYAVMTFSGKADWQFEVTMRHGDKPYD